MKLITMCFILFIPFLICFSLQSKPAQKDTQTSALLEPSLKELAKSKVSMISAANPFATEAGLEMLRKGGNAMDAAVAATLVVGVIEGNTSLAGGGALTYYKNDSKTTTVINFEPNGFLKDVMPYDKLNDRLSGRSTKTSGSFAGLYYSVKKYGNLPWKVVMEPAIRYAERGFPVFGGAYVRMKNNYTTLTLQPSGREIFAPNGFLPRVGEVFKQPELAHTLKNIASEGPDYFYKGDFAQKMVSAINHIGGKASLEDFEAYEVIETKPIRGSYKDFQIVGPSSPADSTVGFIESMNILENVDLKTMGHYTESADSLNWVIEAMRIMVKDIAKFNGIHEYDAALGEVLTSKEYAKRQYEKIRYRISELKKQTQGKSNQIVPYSGEESVQGGHGTHHVSSVDKAGNVCSLMHTIYGTSYSYSGLFVGGLVLNAAGDFVSHPGERIYPQCGPPIVFKGEKPYFAPGSSGGTINPFFLIANILVWDKNFKEAQEAPRFRWDGKKIKMEHRIDENIVNELRKRGYKIEWVAPYFFGTAQVAGIDPDTGIRYGATDPRYHGKAAGQDS